MPTLKISRSDEYINRLRDYLIFVDGKKAGRIANGETLLLEVPAGQIEIFARIDWTRSRKIIVQVGEGVVKEIWVAGFKTAKWMMPLGIFLIVFYIAAVYFFELNYPAVFFISLTPVFVLIYFLTFGSRNYLRISDDGKL